MICSSLFGLAFVPVDKVERAFEVLAGTVPDDDKVLEFVSYFERTFIGDSNGRRLRRRPPQFPT